MKKLKKIAALMLTAAMSVSLMACGAGNGQAGAGNSSEANGGSAASSGSSEAGSGAAGFVSIRDSLPPKSAASRSSGNTLTGRAARAAGAVLNAGAGFSGTALRSGMSDCSAGGCGRFGSCTSEAKDGVLGAAADARYASAVMVLKKSL